MRQFTDSDLHNADSKYPALYANRIDLVDSPLQWQVRGLQQTATGYGRRLTMREKIHYNGRLYRLYATCYSNVASVWFVAMGRKIYVN
jgi:ABC-type Na+ transport system ATPase subunit NatA